MRAKRIIYHSIGRIHSPLKDTEGAPIQPAAASTIRGTVEVEQKYRAGLKDLEGFSHIILIYHFHLVKSLSLEVVPFLDEESHGVFATRAPTRPNAIGISVVKLLKVSRNRLFVENVDVVDGTPLLDIKPFVSQFDSARKSSIGWLAKSAHKVISQKSDGRFK